MKYSHLNILIKRRKIMKKILTTISFLMLGACFMSDMVVAQTCTQKGQICYASAIDEPMICSGGATCYGGITQGVAMTCTGQGTTCHALYTDAARCTNGAQCPGYSPDAVTTCIKKFSP